MLKMPETMYDLVGKLVNIEWFPPEDDNWHAYRVLALNADFRSVLLKGEPEDESEYVGNPIWVPLERICFIEVVE